MNEVSVIYINGRRYVSHDIDADEVAELQDMCQPQILAKEEVRVHDKRSRLLALNNFSREHQPNPMSKQKREKQRMKRKK